MKAVLAWSLVAAVMAVLFPIVYGREDKCTSAETAFMIAKRFTADRQALSIDDQPDFPWETADAVRYEGTCTHRVDSYFELVRDGHRHRIAYIARVQFDRLANRWSLLDWTGKGDVIVP